MKGFLSSIFSSQIPTQAAREGLPYWSFWLLLFIILLLITFIFLRDKDLRQRLNSFFFKAKRKLIKIRLHAKVKKEFAKKEELLKELGKKTWIEGIKVEKGEQINKELKTLENESIQSQKKLEEIDSKIAMLNIQLKESNQKHEGKIESQEEEIKPYREKMKEIKEKEKLIKLQLIKSQKEIEDIEKRSKAAEKEIHKIEDNLKLSDEEKKAKKEEEEEKTKDLKKKKEEINQELQGSKEEKKGIEKEREKLQGVINGYEKKINETEEEKKEESREFNKEIKEWEKTKEKVRGKIREIEKKKEPLFGILGKAVDKLRVNHKDLTIFYSQIDRINTHIQEIENQIEKI